METTPFYVILSAALMLLTASLVMPAYGNWQSQLQEKRAEFGHKKASEAIDTVMGMGDVGSTYQSKIEIPGDYKLKVNPSSLSLLREGKEIQKTRFPGYNLSYHGSENMSGPRKINLSVVHWIEGEELESDKKYLISVIEK